MSVPIPEYRVLPTLNQDGTRRKIRPKLFQGKFHTRRRWVAWGLLALFVGLPFLRVGGMPAVLLDVAERQFTFFGRTFLATDGVLLMLLLLAIFVGVIWVTALAGRAFCGWVCPQTVYMEFVFRPVERFFEGDRGSQLRLDQKGGGLRRFGKNLTFLVLAVLVANVFLSYFVGVETLGEWVMRSPVEHPTGFAVMGITSALVFYDFAFFREQMCTVACPYARLQSALVDRDSHVVGYDARRGEPRKKGKPVPGGGDCIDCGACVVACPTGIDIRDGLQLECIACAQCIDACNTIMPKIGKPLDLILVTSQKELAGEARRVLRPRVVGYGVVLAALVVALFLVGSSKREVDVTVLRGTGAPFVLGPNGVQNQLRVKLENRSKKAGAFSLEVFLDGPGGAAPLAEKGVQVVIPENPLTVAGMERRTTSLFLVSPRSAFVAGRLPLVVRVSPTGGAQGETQEIPTVVLGPTAGDTSHSTHGSAAPPPAGDAAPAPPSDDAAAPASPPIGDTDPPPAGDAASPAVPALAPETP